MAGDSIIGGDGYGQLNDFAKGVLDQALGQQQSSPENSLVVQGEGGVGVATGNKIAVAVTEGVNEFLFTHPGGILAGGTISAPANVVLNFGGFSETWTPAATEQLLQGVVDAAIPPDTTDPGLLAIKEALDGAIQATTANLPETGTDVIIHLLQVFAEANQGTITIDVAQGSAAGKSSALQADGNLDYFIVNLADANFNELILQNAEAVMAIGDGAITVQNADGAVVSGTIGTQLITGFTGNDTLIGGGGNDTLVGGEGEDLFGFVGNGQILVQDFELGSDQFALSEAQAQQYSGWEQNEAGLVIHFGENASITFVGVSVEDVTADFFNWTFFS